MRKKGFTLVETVVVLALMSIASGILVLSFFSAQNDKVMDEAKVLTVNALEAARNRATSGIGEDDHGVRMTADNKIEVFTVNEAGNETVVREISLPSRIKNFTGDVDFVFKRITGEVATEGNFKLKSDITGEEVEIEVKESGSINIE